MGNWLEDDANRDSEFDKNGGELFRNLKAACSAVVDTYNQRYIPGGAELIDCTPINPHCFRVKMAKNGPQERYVELYFRPEVRSVDINRVPSSFAPNTQPPLSGKVGIIVLNGQLVFGDASNHDGVEEMSKQVLEPLFFPNGIRPAPVR